MWSPRMMWQYIYVTAIKSNQSRHTLKLLRCTLNNFADDQRAQSQQDPLPIVGHQDRGEKHLKARHDFSARESHRENINKKTIRPTLLFLSSLSVIKTTSFDTLVTPVLVHSTHKSWEEEQSSALRDARHRVWCLRQHTPPDGCRKLFRLNDAEIPLVKDFFFFPGRLPFII